MSYTVWTDRKGLIQILGACYASAGTAHNACREYWLADVSWRTANHAEQARYWVECEDAPGSPVGKIYGGNNA